MVVQQRCVGALALWKTNEWPRRASGRLPCVPGFARLHLGVLRHRIGEPRGASERPSIRLQYRDPLDALLQILSNLRSIRLAFVCSASKEHLALLETVSNRLNARLLFPLAARLVKQLQELVRDDVVRLLLVHLDVPQREEAALDGARRAGHGRVDSRPAKNEDRSPIFKRPDDVRGCLQNCKSSNCSRQPRQVMSADGLLYVDVRKELNCCGIYDEDSGWITVDVEFQ